MKKLLLILATTALISANNFSLKPIGEKEFTFPYVVSKTKTKQTVADNINTYLHLEYLELLPNSYKSNPFEAINIKGQMPRLYVHDYRISENFKFIALSLNMEGCGAYCEEFEAQKLFLAHNGKHIHARELFTKKGLKLFDRMNHENIQKTIKAFLKTGTDEEQVDLYEDCLNAEYKGKVHEHSDFWIEKDKFTLFSGRCSNHAMRALDDIGDFSNSYSFIELKNYLSPLGNYLLNKHNKEVLNSESPTGIYKGKITGKYPIKLSISQIYDDGSLEASYWYEKYKKVIDLSGSYKNGKLKLYVKKHKPKEKKWVAVEAIVGKVSDGKFKGTWQKLPTGKLLSLEMSLN
ncbi:MAG TPA: hypothetical protein EYG94_00430 [Campylobacterales bacterium]|nr:hypothetical protein [Campylobacterales bacterium]